MPKALPPELINPDGHVNLAVVVGVCVAAFAIIVEVPHLIFPTG